MTKQSKRPLNWLGRKKGPSASTETRRDSSALPPDQNHTPLPITLLQTCREVNLHIYRECLCHGNLQFLVVQGEPTQDQLINTWADLVTEFSGLIKDDNTNYLFELEKNIAELQCHLDFVDNAVALLQHRYKPDLIEKLQEMGYTGKYNYDDRETYLHELRRIKSLAKTKVHDLEDLQSELKLYRQGQNTQGGSVYQPEEDFNDGISVLRRFMHYHIDLKETMMSDYASMINDFRNENKRLAKLREESHG